MTHTQLFTLDHCGDEAGHFRDTQPVRHISHCFPPDFTQLNFLDNPGKSR